MPSAEDFRPWFYCGVGADKLPTRLPVHDQNIEFRNRHATLMVQRIGIALSALCAPEEMEGNGYRLERFFWRELGHLTSPSFVNEIPDFLRSPDTVWPTPLSSQALALKLSELSFPEPRQQGPAACNIEMLGDRLGLTQVERLMLACCYVYGRTHQMDWPDFQFRDIDHKCRVLSSLCDAPHADVLKYVQTDRLMNLKLICPIWPFDSDPIRGLHPNDRLTLSVSGTDLLINLLESEFASADELICNFESPALLQRSVEQRYLQTATPKAR